MQQHDNNQTESDNNIDWINNAIKEFDSSHPGLLEQLSTINTQYQIRISMYPKIPPGGASSDTGGIQW